MSVIIAFISFSLLFVLLTFCFLILRIFTGKSITNPAYPPVKGTVFHQVFYFNRLYDHQTKVAREIPTFRLLNVEQSEVYTTDSRNIEHILKTNFPKYSKGKYDEDIMSDMFGQGIFVVDGEKWKQQRKLASFEFSTKVLRDFSCSVFRKNAAKLTTAVFELTNQVFDMQDILMRCTLDSIFKVGFGIELSCLEGSSKEGTAFMKAFDDSAAQSYWRYVDPFWRLKRSLNIGSEASLRKNVKVIDDFVHQLIRNKRKVIAGKNNVIFKEDILSRFLLESEKDPEGMNDTYLRDIILNFMIAGKDTSANTLSWFLYMLCKNPLVQEKVAHEVRDILGIQATDAKIDELVANLTDTNLEKMHYLHAALTETLRLYPAVPLDGRSAKVDDILPDGFRVRKGDGVYYMAYSMGRMPYIWGKDAEDFRPERWIKNGIFQPESPFKFVSFHVCIIFSFSLSHMYVRTLMKVYLESNLFHQYFDLCYLEAGPRICLGKDFAYRQMKIVSAPLLFFFRFRLADETKHVTYRTMFTLHMDGGLPLRAIPRTD